MALDEATVDVQPDIEKLKRERDEAVSNYEKLQKAHETLKTDFRELKTTAADAGELQKQIQNHIKEKTKLLNEKEALQSAFDGFKKEAQKKDLKQALTTTLTGEVKPAALATALKLINLDGIELNEDGEANTDALKAAVDALKESDPILFKDAGDTPASTPGTPPIRHAVDRMTQSAYETEIEAAVKKGDPKLLEEVVAKYRK